MPPARKPFLHVTPVGMPEEVGFDIHAAFTACKVCGAVFQSDLDRKPGQTPAETVQATLQRRNWSFAHAKTHTDTEHRQLALSGRFCTPEAQYKLAAYGIIAMPSENDDETPHAQSIAPRLPSDSPES